jgi:serine/threonine protein kinase
MSVLAPPLLSADAPEALLPGTRLAEFEVRRVLGSGGFGIVYLAWDHALEREVALKEYMPGTLAGRGAGLQVSVRSSSVADNFALGLRSFVNEARLLARFDHPSLVKVYRFWEDNGTAYMVMPYYVGRTLRQVRQGMVVPPGEAACRRVLDGLLSALEALHREGVYHRDIAPDNILLVDDGLPVLLDFGAARRVLGDRTQALTSIMKPHYAPLEQYADGNAMRQGPWTDLYSLGGTIYFLITGEVPVAAASRAIHDDQPRLALQGARDCSPGLLAAIDWMLALKPPERPQSVHMLRDVLEGRITMPGRKAADKTMPGVAARNADGAPLRTDIDLSDIHADSDAAVPPDAATAVTVRQSPAIAAPVAPVTSPPVTAPGPIPGPEPLAAAHRSPMLRWLLGALVLLNLLAWWAFTRPSPSVAVVPQAAAAAAERAAPQTSREVMSPTTAPAGGATPQTSRTLTPPIVMPVQGAASETILSVMPARSPPLRTPAAASAVLPRPADVAVAVTKPRPINEAASSPTVAQATVVAGAGPRARCGERNFLSMLICMKSECEQPSLRSHPECVKMREQEEGQRDRRQ